MTEIKESEDPQNQNQNQNQQQQNNEFAQTVRKFESSYVRVPFEQFRRAFRLEMKLAEKDLPGLEGLFKKHLGETCASEGGTGGGGSGSGVNENVLKALRERVKGMEEKLFEYRGESKKFRERFLKRMKWTETMANKGNYNNWSRGRLLRLIGDFLIRKGEIELVKEIGRQGERIGLIEEFEIELEEMRKEIYESLSGKDLNLALQWCGDHRNNLKRIGSDLEFKLRRQEFIELLRGKKLQLALKLGQKHFYQWIDTNYSEIKECMGLICWLPILEKATGVIWSNGLMLKYENLYNEEEQWRRLREQFMKDFMSVYQIDDGSQLIRTVQTGLSVLKTRQCVIDEQPTSTTTVTSCPSCTGPLKHLSKHLPFGHFEQTKLRCRITGNLMTENDPPMALPNGQVYSETGLKLLAGWRDGGTLLKCPVTGQEFLINEARKCFFL